MTEMPGAVERLDKIAGDANLALTLDVVTDVLIEIPNGWLDKEDVERLKAVRKELEDMYWKYADRCEKCMREVVAKSCCYD